MDITLLSAHEEILKASQAILERTIQFADQIHARVVTIHADRFPMFSDKEKALQQINTQLKKLSENTQIRLSIENLSHSGGVQIAYPATALEMIELGEKISKKDGVTLDTGHFLKDEENFYPVIEALKNKVVNIHLHDGKKGQAHLALGEGKLDLKKLLVCLEGIEYTNFLTLEVVGKEKIAASWEILKTAMNELYSEEKP